MLLTHMRAASDAVREIKPKSKSKSDTDKTVSAHDHQRLREWNDAVRRFDAAVRADRKRSTKTTRR